ncbi:MAG TPA: carbohydrate kinase, partial [Betaproteobacteria bacterium]|nr:carbohydrate kinase [Betaproteobacteria bacterium]
MHDSFFKTANQTIALFGEVLVDVFPDRQALGGAPFNVARHLRAFGLHPLLITRTGNDTNRERFLAAMRRFDMDIHGVQRDDRYPTGQVRVHLKEDTHVFEILPQQAYDFIDADMAQHAVHAAPALSYFGTLAQRNPVSRAALTHLLAHTDTPIFLDINLRAPWYDETIIRESLRRADVVKLNNEELDIVGKLFRFPGSATMQAQKLMHDFSLRMLIVTCGVEGACV